MLLRITTKLTEMGHMLTCWEDAHSTRRFKDAHALRTYTTKKPIATTCQYKAKDWIYLKNN